MCSHNMFSWRNKKNIMRISLLSGAMIVCLENYEKNLGENQPEKDTLKIDESPNFTFGCMYAENESFVFLESLSG